MDGSLERAKALFFEYGCSHYLLWHDGAEEEYEQYGVSAKQERVWRLEYIDLMVSRLSLDDLEPLIHLKSAQATEALPALLAFAKEHVYQGDSYARKEFANIIWEIRRVGGSRRLRKQAAVLCFDLWQSVICNPITLTRDHYEYQEMMRDIVRTTCPDKLTSRSEEDVLRMAKSELEAAEKYLQHEWLENIVAGCFLVVAIPIGLVISLFSWKRKPALK